MFREEDLLPISALQHYIYCPRQCALIHVEGLWAENVLTVEGGHLHERVDKPGGHTREDVRVARDLHIRSLELGIVGRADVVEFYAGTPPRPVEYKRGKSKSIDADRVQLCAQALCLEEMLGDDIEEADLFYGLTRRREIVPMDDILRLKTTETISALHSMLAKGVTPQVEYHRSKCDNCSLKDLCLPKGTDKARSPSRYMSRALAASLAHNEHEDS